ncbi:MAG: DUF1343 domain-containing protein [Gemmatimonadota bacterium]
MKIVQQSWLRYPAPALLLLFLGIACGASDEGVPAPGEAQVRSISPADTVVLPGIEVLLTDSLHLVEGRRVGLITNHTGIDAAGVPSIDRLHRHPAVELVALYSPEHGIRGTTEAGVLVDHSRDEATGLPVHSLYGETRKPTPAMLEGVEVLLFDIQDIGTRYYTYIYTMGLAMEAAGAAGIPFVVLDRPNPVGGRQIQGNVLDPRFASFVGLHPLPMRHGMTPGELARLYRSAGWAEADLVVVPAAGWTRDALFPETDLPWLPPSPNMPDLESALHYPGTCLFEGTNLSVGRGTDRAFQQVGAPWLDGEELAARMGAYELPGVRFEAVRFTPSNPGDGKFGGEELGGVRLHVTEPRQYDPTATGVALLVESHRLAGDRWSWRTEHFDRLAGTDALRLGIVAGLGVPELTSGWAGELKAFEELREGALLYR